jgi:hypothetical protein
VRDCSTEFEIPYPQSRERRTDASFSVDAHGKQLSLMADGQVGNSWVTAVADGGRAFALGVYVSLPHWVVGGCRTDAALSVDAHGKQLSLMADGQVRPWDCRFLSLCPLNSPVCSGTMTRRGLCWKSDVTVLLLLLPVEQVAREGPMHGSLSWGEIACPSGMPSQPCCLLPTPRPDHCPWSPPCPALAALCAVRRHRCGLPCWGGYPRLLPLS